MKEKNKYFMWGVTATAVIAVSLILFFLLFRMGTILGAVRLLLGTLRPFIYGFVLAYLLLPVFNWLNRRLEPAFRKHKKGVRYARMCSSIISLLFGMCIVGGLLSMVLPQLVLSVFSLVENLQDYLAVMSEWVTNWFSANPILEQNVVRLVGEMSNELNNWVSAIMLPQLVSIMTGFLSTVSILKDIVIGVIIVIYILNSKDLFAAQSKKVLYSVLPIDKANIVIENVRFTHRIFCRFLSGKLLDSLIIGVITFLAMQLMRMPYSVLIAVIIGVTNMIPFFGPFIGAIPSTLLIAVGNPITAIYFVIFILILQQFDGNILGPKILGDSIGLSAFWVMFAILVFGGMFGFAGMLIGVPLFAVLYTLLTGAIKRSLVRRKLSPDTMDYYDLDLIDPDTHMPRNAQKEENSSE